MSDEKLMTKAEVMDYLGNVSARTVQRYAAQYNIMPVYRSRPGKGSQDAFFKRADIEELKKKLDAIKASSKKSNTIQLDAQSDSSNKPVRAVSQTDKQTDGQVFVNLFMDKLMEVAKQSAAQLPEGKQKRKPVITVPIADKLSLSKVEAIALSGLTGEQIEQAIKSNELIAEKRGKWNILRVDLDDYMLRLRKNRQKAKQ
jgi:hypothetical protein